MTDAHTGPEMDSEGPDVEIDVHEVPETADSTGTEASEADNDDVELNGENPWKDIEKNSKKAAEMAEKTGVLKVTEDVIKAQLVSSAMKIEGDMNTPGTEANKLRTVWNALTKEEKSEALEIEDVKWTIFKKALLDPVMTPVNMVGDAGHYIKRKLFSPENLDIKDFNPQKIKMYCSLGLLECSEEDAKAIDQMAANNLKVIAKAANVAKWVALVIPPAEEFVPVIDKAGKAAAILQKPAEWAGNLMPDVRREVKRQSLAVEIKEFESHNNVAEDLSPEVIIPANSPMDGAEDVEKVA